MRQRGMTLIEITIVMAVGSVVTAALLMFMKNIVGMQFREKAISTISQQLSYLSSDLDRIEVCTAAFAGVTFDPSNSAEQSVPNATVTALNLKFEGNDYVKLESTQLATRGLLDSIRLNATTTYERHLANLIFHFSSSASNPGGKDLSKRVIPMQVLVDTNMNKIVSCQANFGDLGAFCELIGGAYDPTGTPPCKLPGFAQKCNPGEVAVAIAAGGFDCIVPPNPPTGNPVNPTPPPTNQIFINIMAIDCGGPCNCPATHPFLIWTTPGAGITCLGYSSIPPANSLSSVMACLNSLPPGPYCAKLNGQVIQTGFGPCSICP